MTTTVALMIALWIGLAGLVGAVALFPRRPQRRGRHRPGPHPLAFCEFCGVAVPDPLAVCEQPRCRELTRWLNELFEEGALR